MRQRNKLKLIASPIFLVALGGSLATACGDDGGGGLLGGDCTTVGVRISALTDGALALTALADGLKLDVAVACAQLADMDMPTAPTDAEVTSLCDAAVLRMNAGFEASANLEIRISPPVCTVNAQAQLNCEAECYVDADVQCDAGSIEARCDPGDLRVQCSGECQANAVCEGRLDLAVECEGVCEGTCEGSCEGSCTGTCSGTCMGTCDGTCSAMGANGQCEGTCDGTCEGSCDADCTGSCDASCTGTCRGSCTIDAGASVECSGGATCKGGCDVEGTAPSCEAALEPPACTGSVQADCNADCEGSASFDAECVPAQVEIVGDLEAELKADVEAALPAILVAVKKGTTAVTAAASYSVDAIAVGVEGLGCIASVGASVANTFKGQVDATAQAAASINVSVEASVSVSASASGSAG